MCSAHLIMFISEQFQNTYRGNCSRTAPPCIQHNSILMPLLQHLILSTSRVVNKTFKARLLLNECNNYTQYTSTGTGAQNLHTCMAMADREV